MKRILTFIGGLTVIFVLVVVVAIVAGRAAKKSIASNTILELNLETALVEDLPDDPIAQFTSQKQPRLRDVVDALDKASGDSRVSGLLAHLGAAPISMAQAQEIRDAVGRFREKGKFTVAWSETFGEFGPANSAYYIATAFDEIWLQPSGDIGLTGFLLESQFLKGTLDKLGLVPRMDQRHEYKNAMNVLTERKYTQPHREAMQAIAESWYRQLLRAVAEGRKMSEDQVRAVVDKAPLLGAEALEAKLVDRLGYRDEVYEKTKERAGSGAKLLYLSHYLDRAGRPHDEGAVIALIYGVGGVQRGESEFDPMSGPSMGSDTVAAAFRAAVDDRNVRAIVFRIDSPGGSYVASDTIWRETGRAKQAGKPVIATMSTLAGSGGYFVAMQADKIVAQPGTITGSIGVLGGKMLTTGFWDKLGISWDEVHLGQNATMFTGTRDYSPSERARWQGFLDRIYEDFTTKVAEGRKLPKEKVLEVAKGRIWSGEDAKNLGLVDELGGIDVAIRLAKAAANIPVDATIELKQYPPKKKLAEAIVAMLQGEQKESSESAVLIRAMETLRPYYRQLRLSGAFGGPQPLEMPVQPR
ncbi:MAG: signal peptide peptidase SppA [Bryobacterales bacterium]|nr:signal peptide peptidase SppA [Bryobacterales bacterium]